jgi:hypothetical protein
MILLGQMQLIQGNANLMIKPAEIEESKCSEKTV